MNTLLRSSDFDAWLSDLADQKAKARILARLTSATFGNFGDCGAVGEGVSEMRIPCRSGISDLLHAHRIDDLHFAGWRHKSLPEERHY